MATRQPIEITELEYYGFFDFRFVQVDRVEEIRKDFEDHFNLLLPDANQWHKFGRIDDLRILLKELTITAVYSNSYWIQFKFYPGYITDLASVPWFFRSAIDNDDPKLMTGALPHDFNFSTHFLNFTRTNQLFEDMAVEAGYNEFKATLAHICVASPAGHYRWRQTAKERDSWTRATSEAMDSSGLYLPRMETGLVLPSPLAGL